MVSDIVDKKKVKLDFPEFINDLARLLDDLRQQTVADPVKSVSPVKAASQNLSAKESKKGSVSAPSQKTK